jgi:transcriptional regulator with XRE-family HTH domain
MPRKPPRDERRIEEQRRIGERVRRVRAQLGWGQREAARVFGFRSASAVSNLENGLNGVDSIDLWGFAEATGYPMEYFVNPDFEERRPTWPRTLMEWRIMAGQDTSKADTHFQLEQAITTGRTAASAGGQPSASDASAPVAASVQATSERSRRTRRSKSPADAVMLF